MSSQVAKPNTDAFFKAKPEFPKRFPNGFPVGKRTEKRQAANKELGKLGIKHCEIRINGKCAGNVMLTWAHPTKSRFLLTDKDWRTAARACLSCHQHIEAMGHTEMRRIVMQAIAKRKTK